MFTNQQQQKKKKVFFCVMIEWVELKLRNRFCEHTKNGSPSSSLHWPTNQSYCPPMCAYIYERQLCRYCFLFLQLLLVAVPSERINLEKLKFFDNSTFAWECSDISTKFSSITSSDFCLLCSTIFFYICLFVFFFQFFHNYFVTMAKTIKHGT